VAALRPLQLVRPLPMGVLPGRELRSVDEEMHQLRKADRWCLALLVVVSLVVGFACGATLEAVRHARQQQGAARGDHRHNGRGARGR
jgi:hypothetical protein